jgi:hypothetical protein
VTVNVVHDHYKSALAEKRGAGQTDPLSDGARTATAPSAMGNFDAMERRIFLLQVDEALTRCAAGEEQTRNSAIFWLHYQHGLSARYRLSAFHWLDNQGRGKHDSANDAYDSESHAGIPHFDRSTAIWR